MNWRLVLAIVVVLVLVVVVAGAIIIRSFTPTGPAVEAVLAIAGVVDLRY